MAVSVLTVYAMSKYQTDSSSCRLLLLSTAHFLSFFLKMKTTALPPGRLA